MVRALQDEMLAAIPRLKAFAVSLCRNRDRADDLVQETLLRACDKITTFELGTNMQAWLITILRNQFYGEYRKRRRCVQDVDRFYMQTMVSQPEQLARMQYEEFSYALGKLPRQLREILILVAVRGLSYPEAAQVCECPTGTIKSRLHRARACLAAMLSIESVADIAADPLLQSIVVRAESA